MDSPAPVSVFGKCPECDNVRYTIAWCDHCDVERLRNRFSCWSSGNCMIDNFIRHTQLNPEYNASYLEWIDFSDLELIENSGKKGAYSSIYSAIWLEGPKSDVDMHTQNLVSSGPTKVALKRLDNSINITQEYINQLYEYQEVFRNGNFAKVFGITKDPTSNYMFVMSYYPWNLYSYINDVITWKDIIDMLSSISLCLDIIHDNDLIHGHLHGGNILIFETDTIINVKVADVGLHGPADKNHSDQKIYGVVPFIAPEIFYNQTPTKESDVYSFGMIMWMLASGLRPYFNKPHNRQLIEEIKNGLKPYHIKDAPPTYHRLLDRCLDSDPKNRPTSSELYNIFEEWTSEVCDNSTRESELCKEFEKAEDNLDKKSVNMSDYFHEEAIYYSRPLDSIM